MAIIASPYPAIGRSGVRLSCVVVLFKHGVMAVAGSFAMGGFPSTQLKFASDREGGIPVTYAALVTGVAPI